MGAPADTLSLFCARMTKVLIVYASSTGNTKKMAEAVVEGARHMEGVEAQIRSVEEVKLGEVLECDALILGSPVRHGNADSRLRYFMEIDCASLASSGRLSNKIAAVFTVGGHFGRQGDGGEIAQFTLLRAFATAGMTIVSAVAETRDTEGARAYWGPHARLRIHGNGRETLQPDTLAHAREHGRRVAGMACALSNKEPPRARTHSRLPNLFYRLSAAFR